MALISVRTKFCEPWILHSKDIGQFSHYGQRPNFIGLNQWFNQTKFFWQIFVKVVTNFHASWMKQLGKTSKIHPILNRTYHSATLRPTPTKWYPTSFRHFYDEKKNLLFFILARFLHPSPLFGSWHAILHSRAPGGPHIFFSCILHLCFGCPLGRLPSTMKW